MIEETTPNDRQDSAAQPQRPQIPLSVQILSTLLYGAFAITVVAIAFGHSWPAAVLLAAFLGWRGGFTPNFGQPSAQDLVVQLRGVAHETPQRPHGNKSFESYRQDMLLRLEHEQDRFDRFLGRLRDAKDKSEFDHFMEERAAAAVQSS